MQHDNARFWHAIRAELQQAGIADAPQTLDGERKPVPDGIEPTTLFTQVCGWPLQTIYAGQGIMLGTPVYDVAYCAGPTHAGVFVVHANADYASLAALRGCRFVFNSIHSNSGMNLPRRAIADIAHGQIFFGEIAETHSHPANLERVARGEADATCVDCVTYAFFIRHRPQFAKDLRVLAATDSTPSLPFVTSVATPLPLRSALQEALFRVARQPEWEAARSGLFIRDVVPPDPDAYRTQCTIAAEAVDLGYPHLV
jgi:ABC-type phosphate/phosphonate transport system substrate-binding protein